MTLLIRDRERVRVLAFNRPDKRNAIDTRTYEALVEALAAADTDPTIGALVITGNGSAFCAGADTTEFRDGGPGIEARKSRRTALLQRVEVMIPGLRKPVIAAINGAAVGAGAGIALSADMAVMSETARLGFPEVRHGLIPSLMIPPLIRNVGRKAAFALLAVGELIDARTAASWGLVNEVVPPAAVLDTATRLAAQVAEVDQRVMAGTKKLFYECAERSLAEAVAQAGAFPQPNGIR